MRAEDSRLFTAVAEDVLVRAPTLAVTLTFLARETTRALKLSGRAVRVVPLWSAAPLLGMLECLYLARWTAERERQAQLYKGEIRAHTLDLQPND